MVVETNRSDFLEREVVGQTGTGDVNKSAQACCAPRGELLELLILINDLDPVFILLPCRLLANICKMAVDCHDRWSSRMSVSGWRPVLLSCGVW